MAEFPGMKGLSFRNLKYIRQWYKFYNERLTIGQQVVAQLGEANVQQPVAQISEDVFFSVPWGHHLYIICQSYQEETDRQPCNWFAYLQDEEQRDGTICP